MSEKQLKIINDYYIQYKGDEELFDLHKPSDIRCLIGLLNCALCRQEKTIEALEKEIHHSKILANGFIIEKGLIKEFIKWSKEND